MLPARCCRKVNSALLRSARCYTSDSLPKPRLDYRSIAENALFKSHNAINRKAPLPVGAVQTVARLYEQQRDVSSALNMKRHAQSTIGERIRTASDAQARHAAIEEAKALKSDIVSHEQRLDELEDALLKLALAIPNDTHSLSPIGPESAAEVLSSHGPPPTPFSPEFDHVSVGHGLELFDLEAGSTVTGSSWFYLCNAGALLELALTNYALSIAMKHGFKPVMTPDVVRADIASRCGFQPRDNSVPHAQQMYSLAESHPELVLSGTAEIPLAGMFANKILDVKDFPVKIVGLGKAFRAEAGARGADTRGLYRVHQFTKVELFALTEEERSEEMMEEIKKVQIEIFEGLGFPFRVLDMPTEELGASAYRKYDMEAWMPGRGSWGEISSTSNCTDYQARRLHIRYRRSPPSVSSSVASISETQLHSRLPFAHTLNGTAAAIPRLIVALLENGATFNKDGQPITMHLPLTLKPFWLGLDKDEIRWH